MPTIASPNSLRFKLVLMVISLVVVVVALISAYFLVKHQGDLREAMASRTQAMKTEVGKKGIALAGNVAMASERAIAVLDYLFLTEVLTTTMKNDDGVLYGIVMDNERRALVHTDPALAGTILDADKDKSAAAAGDAVALEHEKDGQHYLEAVAPIHVGGKRWGTIRLGMSLERVEAEIASYEREGQRQITNSIVAVLLVALLLIIVASIVGATVATQVVKPLRLLLAGVNRIREGNFDVSVDVRGSAEFVNLAVGFNAMRETIRERDARLRQNVEDLRIAFEKAEEASRLKSQFLANISHELRTPLNAIVNVPVTLLSEYSVFAVWTCAACGGVFQSDDPTGKETPEACPDCGKPALSRGEKVFLVGDPGQHRHFLNRLRQQARHLLNVVNDLLDFSKVEAKRMQLNLAEVDVAAVLRDLAETVDVLAHEKGLEIVYTSEPGATLVADPLRLTQVLMNLVGNAIKFTPKGGRIDVRVERQGDKLRFSVADSGIGIPKDKHAIVFESFRQVDGSHTRAHGGTGLGLAIAKQLVEMHKGRMWLESEVGKGSTFVFEIPVSADDAVADDDTVSANADAGGAKVRVMVIDDNEVHLEVARIVLEKRGFVTELVSKPAEVLERVKGSPPDLIILDVMMPEVSGVAILKRLKENPDTATIPVFVASAYDAHRERVEELGAIWLPKPWNAQTVAQLFSTAVSEIEAS
ncbi:MAG: ATP-binding protein [Myxococcota bacterium]